MTYDATDPRAALQKAATVTAPRTGLLAEEQLGLFYKSAPQIATETEKTWLLRGCNFVVAQSDCAAGAVLSRTGQTDEYAVLLPDQASRAIVSWQGQRVELTGAHIVFVPAADSCIELPAGGRVTRLFTARSADLVALCGNSAAYAIRPSHIPPFEPWPTPAGGWKIRAYSLDVPAESGRFGRIFRCTTFMVNVFEPMVGPRDPAKMSPHHHDDFEQLSLLLDGKMTHHLRWNWTTDLADWQPDKHIAVAAPSALVIPPPVIHTSQATGQGDNNLVDIFCPPRIDFSQKPGWVLNTADYPMPEEVDDAR